MLALRTCNFVVLQKIHRESVLHYDEERESPGKEGTRAEGGRMKAKGRRLFARGEILRERVPATRRQLTLERALQNNDFFYSQVVNIFNLKLL